MDVNTLIQELKEVTGLDVSPDIYTGQADSYIVYAYNDERPVFWGDDKVLADTAIIQINLYTPPKADYMDLKHQIRDYLESVGIVSDIQSWLDTYNSRNNLEVTVRHTAFTVEITKER